MATPMMSVLTLLGIGIDLAQRLAMQSLGVEVFQGTLHLSVEDPSDPRRGYLRLDWLAHLFGFTSDGTVAPHYPQQDQDCSLRPLDERKGKGAELPEISEHLLDMPVSPQGTKTLVVLAHEETPLPRGDAGKLARLLAVTSISSLLDLYKAIWTEDGEEVAIEPSAAPGRYPSGDDALTRGIPSPKPRKSDDPVLRIRALLNEKVKPLGSYSQAVLFPNQGGS